MWLNMKKVHKTTGIRVLKQCCLTQIHIAANIEIFLSSLNNHLIYLSIKIK